MWLCSVSQLAQYADSFQENKIDGQALNSLTREESRKLGILKVGHWNKIRRKGKSLKVKKMNTVTCDKGHNLSISTFSAGSHSSDWICDICKDLRSGERYFCQLCQYDICISCATKK